MFVCASDLIYRWVYRHIFEYRCMRTDLLASKEEGEASSAAAAPSILLYASDCRSKSFCRVLLGESGLDEGGPPGKVPRSTVVVPHAL